MKKIELPVLIALVCLLCAIPGSTRAATAPGTEEDKKIEPLKRIGIMGASVSAGFGLETNLGAIIDKAIKTPHEMIDTSSNSFFMEPREAGRRAIEQLKARKATVAIGLDFFFWYSYGSLGAKDRFDLFKTGCALADQLKCPIVVGDIPDMSAAVGGMLRAEQVPSREVLRALNKQLYAWAAERPHVHVIPLSAWIETLHNEKPIVIEGRQRTFKKGELMQDDKLHTNEKGLALLAIKCLETLVVRYPAVDRRDLVLGLETLTKAVTGNKKGSSKKEPSPRKERQESGR